MMRCDEAEYLFGVIEVGEGEKKANQTSTNSKRKKIKQLTSKHKIK